MLILPDSENGLRQTCYYLVQIQKELRKMLQDCAVTEPVFPKHSLFSSKRIFRSDEMHLGLLRFGVKPGFSAN